MAPGMRLAQRLPTLLMLLSCVVLAVCHGTHGLSLAPAEERVVDAASLLPSALHRHTSRVGRACVCLVPDAPGAPRQALHTCLGMVSSRLRRAMPCRAVTGRAAPQH